MLKPHINILKIDQHSSAENVSCEESEEKISADFAHDLSAAKSKNKV